jgi:heavy-metal-associated domain-containing protein
MSARPRVFPVHHIPGRARLRVPARRGDVAFFEEVGGRLRRLPNVTRVETRPTTGSILVYHSGALDQLIEAAFGSDLADLVELALRSPPVARRLQREAAAVDEIIRRYTGNELDLTTVASLGLFTFAGIQLVRGWRPATAVSLAWYATELMWRWSGPVERQEEPRAQYAERRPRSELK